MDSKEKILAAAIDVFAEKGKHGARMEEIAEKAGINKAMLYYFFSTRENLYIEALSSILRKIAVSIAEKIEHSMKKISTHADRLKIVAQSHFETYSQNINLTKVLLEAMATNPADVEKAVAIVRLSDYKGRNVFSAERFFSFVTQGVTEGVFRKVNPKQLLISIVGMNMIYFISHPIAQAFLQLGVDDEKKFIKERQDSITDLLLYGIMQKRNS
jgi:AcrR family transcriptional regulator